MKGYYEMTQSEKRIVEIARNMMREVEENRLFQDDDDLWNAAMSAGNKMVTIGLPFSRFNNCLLYTSPSPRDLSTSRMPSSA